MWEILFYYIFQSLVGVPQGPDVGPPLLWIYIHPFKYATFYFYAKEPCMIYHIIKISSLAYFINQFISSIHPSIYLTTQYPLTHTVDIKGPPLFYVYIQQTGSHSFYFCAHLL